MTVDLVLPGLRAPARTVRGGEDRMACTADDVTLLFRAEYARLCRAVAQIVGDRGLAEQTVQDAFLILYRNRARVDNETAAAYVWKIALNEGIDTAKRSTKEIGLVDSAARQGLLPAEHQLAPTASTPDRLVEGAHIRALVAALPEDQRAVVVLHYFCDMPDEEIARTLKAKPVTVRGRLRRARLALKEQVERGERYA